MNKMTWCWLVLKQHMKRPVYWVAVLAMLFLMWLVNEVTLPREGNVTVVFCNEDKGGELAGQLVERLEVNSDFHFVEVASPETVKAMVVAETAECGFVVTKHFSKEIEQEDFRKCVEYIYSPLSSKGAVVKEVFFREFLSVYSNVLIEHLTGEVFSDRDYEEALKEIELRFQAYKESDELFGTVYEEMPVKGEEGLSLPKTKPLKGMVAVMIFLHVLYVAGESLVKGKEGVEETLSLRERSVFRFLKCIASSLPMAVVGYIGLYIAGERLHFWKEAGLLCLYIGLVSLVAILLTTVIKKQEIYYGCIFPVLLLNVGVAPVFFDFAIYFPVIGYLRWLLPIGIYLIL